jgi:GNAT superfamily N-acetyltransferase
MVLSKWMRSLRYGNDYFKLIDSDAFYNVYQRYLKNILNRPAATIRLAVLSDDHDVVLGFCVTEGGSLHYVYVQQEQRNKKIGAALIPKGIQVITHLTKAGMSIWHKKLSHLTFNPFI